MSEADPDPRAVERRVFSWLRRGHLVDALDAVAAVPAGERSLELAILDAEAAACFGRSDLDELEELRERAHAAAPAGPGPGTDPGTDLGLDLRVEAALADHYATRGSELCGLVATQALDGVAEARLRSPGRLWARGRLWRTLALASLFLPDDRPARSLSLLERAKADLGQAGFDAEGVRSAADLHFIWTLAFDEDYERSHHTIDECLARLRHHDSTYVDLVLAYRAYLDLVNGDLPATHAHTVEVEEIGARRPLHPFALVTASYIRVAIRLVTEGPTPPVVRAADDHLTTVRTASLPMTSGQLVGLASILLDLGHTDPPGLEVARRWAVRAAAGEPSTPRTSVDLAALEMRLDLLETGNPAAVGAIDADVAACRQAGLPRDAAHRALRAGLAARRVGLHDDAERLYLAGLADLPPPARRTLWEHALASAAGAGLTAPHPTTTVRLLRGDLEIHAGAATRTPGAATARLVAALVAEGGAAPADRLIDALWPDAEPATGRRRLRVALHRLRGELRDGTPAEPVPRRGDLVVLAPEIDVDAMRFEKLATGSTGDRRAALQLYDGPVLHAQLAYDDVVAPLRRRLAALWRDLARETLAGGDASRSALVRVARVAGLDAVDPEMDGILREAEERLGR